VQPAAPNLKVPIATVIHAHPSNGTLFIRPSHFPDLNQINDVQLTSPTTGQTLIYNSVTGVWSNQTPADPSSTNELQTLSTGTNTLTLSNGGGTVTVDTDPASDVTGSGTSGQVSFWTGAQTQSGDGAFIWDNTNKALGIGLNNPSAVLSVKGLGLTSSTSSLRITDNNNTTLIDCLDNGTSTFGKNTTLTASGNYAIIGGTPTITNAVSGGLGSDVAYLRGGMIYAGSESFNAARGLVFFANNRNTNISNRLTGLYLIAQNDNAASRAERLTGSELYLFNNSTGGTVTDVIGYRMGLLSNSATITNTYGILIDDITPTTGTQTNVYSIYVNDILARMVHRGSVSIGTTGSAARLHVVGSTSSSTTWTAQFHNSAGNNNALMIRDDGNVGIGTSSVTARLNIAAAGTSASVNAINTTNGTPSNIFAVRENGDIYGLSGILSLGSDGRVYTNRLETKTSTTGLIELTGGHTGNSAINFNTFTTVTKTSGSFSLTQYATGGFQPTSGNATFTFQTINGVINQSGGANGISRGLLVAPTLTSAADWRSIEWSNNTGFGLYGSGTADNYLNGNLGIKTTSPTDLIDINGANGYSQLRLRTAYTPTGTADANGNTGDVSWDDNYIYIKTTAGWKRSALSTF
jgi:hypothetical protein